MTGQQRERAERQCSLSASCVFWFLELEDNSHHRGSGDAENRIDFPFLLDHEDHDAQKDGGPFEQVCQGVGGGVGLQLHQGYLGDI